MRRTVSRAIGRRPSPVGSLSSDPNALTNSGGGSQIKTITHDRASPATAIFFQRSSPAANATAPMTNTPTIDATKPNFDKQTAIAANKAVAIENSRPAWKTFAVEGP